MWRLCLVCHTKQTSLWNRGPWVARCRAPAPALRSPPGFVTFFANPPPSTLLYNPTLQPYSTLQPSLQIYSQPPLLFHHPIPPPALFTTQPPNFLLLQTKSSLCLIERLDFQMLTQKSWCYKSQLPCIHFCVWSNTSVVLKHSTLKISAVKSDNYNLVKWPSCGVFSVQSMWPNDLWPFLRDHQLERQKIVGKLEIVYKHCTSVKSSIMDWWNILIFYNEILYCNIFFLKRYLS